RRENDTQIHFRPIGITSAQRALKDANRNVQQAQQPRQQNQQAALQKAVQEAQKKLKQITVLQAPQLLNLVTAANECGLLATPVHDDSFGQEGAAAVRALAERVAELQTDIRAQARFSEEERRSLFREYNSRTQELRKEHDDRLNRMKADHETWEA